MYYEPQIKTAKAGDIEMNYVVFGKGEKPFVILPGLSLTPITDSARAIAYGYQSFAEDYTVYVIDRKTVLEEDYTIYQLAEETAQIMMSLGIRDAYIFGASQGGAMAQLIAINHPQLAKKIALGSTISRASGAYQNSLGSWTQRAREGNIRELNLRSYSLFFTEEYIRQYKEQIEAAAGAGTQQDLARYIILAGMMKDFDFHSQLSQIQCPALVISSTEDRVAKYDESVAIRQAIPGARLHTYHHYAHAVYDEAPDYKDVLHAFFEE